MITCCPGGVSEGGGAGRFFFRGGRLSEREGHEPEVGVWLHPFIPANFFFDLVLHVIFSLLLRERACSNRIQQPTARKSPTKGLLWLAVGKNKTKEGVQV